MEHARDDLEMSLSHLRWGYHFSGYHCDYACSMDMVGIFDGHSCEA